MVFYVFSQKLISPRSSANEKWMPIPLGPLPTESVEEPKNVKFVYIAGKTKVNFDVPLKDMK